MELLRTQIIRITQSPYIYNTSKKPNIVTETTNSSRKRGDDLRLHDADVHSCDGVRCLQTLGIRLLTPIEALSTDLIAGTY
jgi:hypothetical protein